MHDRGWCRLRRASIVVLLLTFLNTLVCVD
jgi:hypothetical protein